MIGKLGQRVVTALVLAPLFVWAMFAMPTTYFSYLLLVFVTLGAWEFAKLIKLQSVFLQLFYTISIIAVALVAKGFEASLSLVLYISIAWWVVNLYWVLSYPARTNLWFKPLIVRLISGVLLLVPMWLALSALHQNPDHGAPWFLLLTLIIWGADSGAYITGKAIGKHKLVPRVSPGKSVEGVIGGIGFALVVMVAFLQYQDIPTDKYLGYLLLTVVISSVSVLGDLFESLFKRESGMKDSGRILPGHGGVLDRIDSLTAAAPFFLLGINLL